MAEEEQQEIDEEKKTSQVWGERHIIYMFDIIYNLHTCISGYSTKNYPSDEIFHSSAQLLSNTPRCRYITDKYIIQAGDCQIILTKIHRKYSAVKAALQISLS